MEFALTILSVIGALFSLGLGLMGLLIPSAAMRLVGLVPHEKAPHAISEVRATYGGVFIGVSAFALATGEPLAFLALASCWVFAMISRIISIVIDRVANQHNLVSVLVEGGIGLAVAAPHWGVLRGLLD